MYCIFIYTHCIHIYIYTHYLHSSLGYGSKNGTTFITFPAGCTILFPPQPSEALRCMAFVCWPPVLLAFWLVPNVKYVKSPKWHVTSRITALSSATPSRRHPLAGDRWKKTPCLDSEKQVNFDRRWYVSLVEDW